MFCLYGNAASYYIYYFFFRRSWLFSAFQCMGINLYLHLNLVFLSRFLQRRPTQRLFEEGGH